MNEDQQAKLRSKVICALDLATMDEALELVDALSGYLSLFKVGSRMFTRYGPKLLEELSARDVEVFLDLKFHDIPNTVAGAVESAASFESVFMMTVHAAGGAQMIARAVDAAHASSSTPPKVVAVTALTSLAGPELRRVGVEMPLEEWARRLGQVAVEAGADGLVCSAHEAADLRAEFGRQPLLVTPGIRPLPQKMADDDDQSRVMTPADALAAGSSFLVIGRPIYRADDPVAAVAAIGESV